MRYCCENTLPYYIALPLAIFCFALAGYGVYTLVILSNYENNKGQAIKEVYLAHGCYLDDNLPVTKFSFGHWYEKNGYICPNPTDLT